MPASVFEKGDLKGVATRLGLEGFDLEKIVAEDIGVMVRRAVQALKSVNEGLESEDSGTRAEVEGIVKGLEIIRETGEIFILVVSAQAIVHERAIARLRERVDELEATVVKKHVESPTSSV